MTQLRRLEAALASTGAAYLVGSGNWPTAPASADRDYVTAAITSSVATELAALLRGRAFLMDERRQYWRLVAPRLPIVDIAPLAGPDIGHDLSLRDFTMNAVAAMLPEHRPRHDPFRGLTDLRHGLVRQVSRHSMSADPLRVLRGLRLASEHGFIIEADTWRFMREAAPALFAVKPERIRMELLRTLQGAGWQAAALACSDLGIWTGLPLSRPLEVDSQRMATKLAALASRLPSVRAAESRIGGLRGLDSQRGLGLAALGAALLSAGLDAEAVRPAADELRLSSRETNALAGMVGSALDMGTDAIGTRRAYALVERFGAAAAWGAGLAGNDTFLEAVTVLHLPALVALPDGRALAEAVGRPPGPWLGRLVDHLQRVVALGDVSPGDALDEAVRWSNRRRGDGAHTVTGEQEC